MASSSFYLSARQRAEIASRSARFWWRLEIPTWTLIATVYSGWFALVYFWEDLGPWIATPALIWFTAWYMSLQHELIHGHPTRKPWLNQLLGTCRWRSGIPMVYTATRIYSIIAMNI